MDFWNNKNDYYKRGMKKQPAKSKVFTKESLTQIQDEMRESCIKSYNKIYSKHSLLKQKKKGRNQDIDVKDITQTVRSVNDLNIAIKDFEHSAFEIDKENRSLKYQLELKDDEISNFKSELSSKDKIIK